MPSGVDSNLITPASIDNVDDSISALVTDKLQAHSLMPYAQVHGNWASNVQNAMAVQSKVRIGRRLIRVKVGLQYFLLPADPSVNGPPAFPVITVHVLDTLSLAPGGSPQPPITLQVQATGLQPLRFTWQIYNSKLPPAGLFSEINNYVDAAIGVPVGGAGKTQFTPVTITSIQVGPTTASSTILIDCRSNGNSTDTNPSTYIRCKVDNLDIDGGVVISNPVNTQWNGTVLVPIARLLGGAKIRVKDESS